MPGGMDVRLDTHEWFALKAELTKFDPALTRALRLKIRASAEVAVEAVKAQLREPTPEGNPSGPGRDALIAGTRVSISFSRRSAGAKITTSGSRLPAGHAGLLKVYNLASFRHPVFGTDTWVEEAGHPYFQKPIEESVGATLYRGINDALDEAIAAIGGRL